jgi:lipopolysaccharide/colanic/teichoic acid biosynthesis glycosyltransferase
MLSSSAYAKALFGRLRGSSVGTYPETIPVRDCMPVHSIQIIEVAQEKAPEAPSARQETDDLRLLDGNPTRSLYFALKRCTDVCLAGAILILLLPLFLLIASLIKLDSRGPVFFTHERVGAKRQGRGRERVWVVTKFGMHKFRSMVQNADSSVHEAYIRDFVEGRVQPNEGSGGKFKLTNDSRVTRVGRLLRRTSLDELPQLFNVLKGEMSLVGPRPVPSYEVACYRNGEHKRLAALPGITGLWQVNGRCQVSFEEMIRMDLEYIRKASFWLDFRILLQTIPAVLYGRGAE